ncbi:MAG: hypothetical protein JWM99_1055 [Verrucomicrobiales bacterium]|nr:hypothetical protein [Verrucomicrobiales bacterium]
MAIELANRNDQKKENAPKENSFCWNEKPLKTAIRLLTFSADRELGSMDIFFSISAGPGGHFICCYDQECHLANELVRSSIARAWRSAEEAEAFALDRGWHPLPDEMARRLHAGKRKR